MEKIGETINKLISDSYGGVITIWLSITYFFTRVLKWCGEQIIKGGIETILSRTRKEIKQELQLTKEELIEEFKKDLSIYKNEKHKIEGENLELIDAVINGDNEKLNLLKNYYGKRNR